MDSLDGRSRGLASTGDIGECATGPPITSELPSAPNALGSAALFLDTAADCAIKKTLFVRARPERAYLPRVPAQWRLRLRLARDAKRRDALLASRTRPRPGGHPGHLRHRPRSLQSGRIDRARLPGRGNHVAPDAAPVLRRGCRAALLLSWPSMPRERAVETEAERHDAVAPVAAQGQAEGRRAHRGLRAMTRSSAVRRGEHGSSLWLALGLPLALGALVLSYRLGAASLFVDEVYSWRAAASGLGALLHRVHVDEVAPPTYYLLLHGWISLLGTDAEWALRLPSAVAGLSLIGLTFWLANELGGRRAGTIAATATAVSPLVLEYGQQARAYVFVMAAVTLAVAAAARAARSEDLGPRWLALSAAAAGAALWIHYSGPAGGDRAGGVGVAQPGLLIPGRSPVRRRPGACAGGCRAVPREPDRPRASGGSCTRGPSDRRSPARGVGNAIRWAACRSHRPARAGRRIRPDRPRHARPAACATRPTPMAGRGLRLRAGLGADRRDGWGQPHPTAHLRGPDHSLHGGRRSLHAHSSRRGDLLHAAVGCVAAGADDGRCGADRRDRLRSAPQPCTPIFATPSQGLRGDLRTGDVVVLSGYPAGRVTSDYYLARLRRRWPGVVVTPVMPRAGPGAGGPSRLWLITDAGRTRLAGRHLGSRARGLSCREQPFLRSPAPKALAGRQPGSVRRWRVSRVRRHVSGPDAARRHVIECPAHGSKTASS